MTAPRVIADSLTLVRAADQLLVVVLLENLELVGAKLTPTGGGSGFLTLVLPAQHTAESTILTLDPVPPGPYANRVSGPSQLRYEIAPGTTIPYSVEGLLDWTNRTLVLDPRGAVSGGPYPTTAPTTSFVEMPQALYLSPGVGGRFVSQAQPRTFGTVTELWRMRLGRLRTVDGAPVVLEPPHTEVRVRAIWTDDHAADVPASIWLTAPHQTPDDEFPRLPTRLDQRHLVRAMGDHDMDAEYPAHEAATIDRLWLSLAGGWLSAAGSFSGPGVLAAWEQRVATGRDVHVRVAHRGWLAPFGHLASVIAVAERTFEVDTAGGVTAALRQRELLSVTPNRVDVASLAGAMPHAGRELPFRSVDLVSNVIVEISRSPVPDADDSVVFVPIHVGDGTPVLLDYTATDRTERQASFALSGVFVRADAAADDVAAAIDYYAASASADLRSTDLGGAPVAYADEPPGTEGDGKTTLSTWQMSFTLSQPTVTLPDGVAALVPAMETATVVDDNVDTLRGQDAEPFTVRMAQEWLTSGLDLDLNVALGFLDLDVPIVLPFSGDGSGITAPDLSVEQLTALIGPAVKLLNGGEWDPATALGDQALFMGSVQLEKLIATITNISGDTLAENGLPRFDITLHRPDPHALPDSLCISLTWQPPLKSFPETLLVAQDIDDSPFPAAAEGKLDFLVEHCIPLDNLGAEPATTVDVAVRNIMVQLPPPNPIIGVAFSKVRFYDPPDGSADVDVDIAAVRFLGALTFLDPIQEFLAGLGGGPRLDIRDDAVQADLTFPLPDISLGVLGITGLEVGTGLVIDLTGGPLRSAFNLGTRSDPFTLSVMGFGGSGSVELEASPHPVGIVRLELSLAFVIELSVDVVVAKGSLRASFGASLELTAIEVDGDVSADVTLGAFLDILGEVQVLGLISIVVQVLLTLEYTASTGLLVGEATVTASVDVGFIEKEVSFTISQEMALGDGDGARSALARSAMDGSGTTDAASGFATRFPTPQLWDSYCAAFAT